MINVSRLPRGLRDDGRRRYDGMYVGVVKDNRDPTRMGRLSVYIPEISGGPNDPASWITCSYASPFAGATPFRPSTEGGDVDGQISYGFWAVPPDLDNLVLVCFANGDPAQAFWIACIYQQRMNHMVPGLAVNRVREAQSVPGTGGGGSGGGGGAANVRQASASGQGAGQGGQGGQQGGQQGQQGNVGQTPFGPYNVGFYRSLPEAQEGAARHTAAANFVRQNPHLYTPEEQRAAFRLEAASNAEVARLSGNSAPAVGAPPRTAPTVANNPPVSTAPQASTQAENRAIVGASAAATRQPAQQAVQFFQNQGWSLQQASGLVGGMLAGNNLNPTASEAEGGGRGIGLWSGDRLTQFSRFAQTRGWPTDISEASLEQQLAFLQDELTRPFERQEDGSFTPRDAEGRPQPSIPNPIQAIGNQLQSLTSPEGIANLIGAGNLLGSGAQPITAQRVAANATAAAQAVTGPNNLDPAARADQAVPQPARAPDPANARTSPNIRQVSASGNPEREWAPVIEYNKNTEGNPDRPRRVAFEPLARGLETQGLVSDPLRGPSSSSARRESPSKVFGLLSPRGNSIHMDDEDDNEFIRLRTRSGVQVLIHETTGFVYINSKDGNAWLEISDRGVDIYSQNSVSIRAEQNLNVRADKSIIFDAGNMISMRAANGIFMESGKGITGAAQQNIVFGAGGRLALVSEGDMTAGTSGSLRMQAGGDATSKSGGKQVRQGSSIQDNSEAAPDATPPEFGVPRAAALHGVETTVTRMPTREPWPEHPRSDVPPPRVPNDDEIIGQAANPGSGTGGVGEGDGQQRGQRSGDGEQLPAASSTDGPRCMSGARTLPVSTEVFTAIREASDRTGVPFGLMMATAHQESAFRPDARARTSSAGGLFQFIDGTWNSMVRNYGAQFNVGPNDRFDPRASALMGAQYMRMNSDHLARNGLPTGNTEIYMAHFLGAGGATTMLREFQRNPNRPAAEVNPAAAAANRSVFYRPDGTPRTVAEVRAWAEQKIEPRAQAYAAQAGQPAPCQRDGATPAPTREAAAGVSTPAAGTV